MTYWVVSENFQERCPTISVYYTRATARMVKKAAKLDGLQSGTVKMFKLVEVR